MTITPRLFEAYLKCPTKCWLKSINENSTGSSYAEWVETQNEAYLADGRSRLLSGALRSGCTVVPETDSLRVGKWPLAVDVPGQTREFPSAELRNGRKEIPAFKSEVPSSGSEINQSFVTSVSRATVESRLHAVERIPAKGPGKPAQFVPIRFVFKNKLDKYDKLLLAFDALVLSETVRRRVCLGKMIHGNSHSMLRVKIVALASEVRKHIEKIATLLSSSSPPFS